MPHGTFGAAVELVVAGTMMMEGWSVFRSLSPHCYCDLIAVKDGRTRHLEVRTGWRQANGTLVYGTKTQRGATEIAVYIPDEREILFILVENQMTRK